VLKEPASCSDSKSTICGSAAIMVDLCVGVKSEVKQRNELIWYIFTFALSVVVE
jgi:hypothetical protein